MMRITPGGHVGIGTNNPLYKLDVGGRLHLTGNLLADSTITAMHLYAIQKVTADALQVNNASQLNGTAVFGGNITIDGTGSSITSSSGEISFGNNNLISAGSLQSAECKIGSLAGNGKKLLQADSLGNIIFYTFPGNAGLVLYGNGTWDSLPQKSPWIADSNGIYPEPALLNKNVFVDNLYASSSVNIGTFRFRNGALPGERDTISAERRVVFYAPAGMKIEADTLTMKNSVGIGVDRPQYALDVAGDINTSGTVYANNLYAQNSIAIGTLRISNGGMQPPGVIRDSISSPYKLALVSAGREISLISDTVKIGDYNSTVRFDVNGSVRVRDVLWVETGLIVGKKFEGDKATVDTVAAISVAATSVTAVNVTAQNVAAGNFNADSLTSAISRSDSVFTFKLGVAGDAKIKGNAEITGNLKVSGSLTGIAGFDSLHVLNNIKIGSSMYLLGYGGGNLNHIYTDDTGDPTLYIQSKTDNYNTIINANNSGIVGIGIVAQPADNYENPGALKLDVAGHARFYSLPDGNNGGTSNYLRVGYNGANSIIDNYGTGGLLINYYSGKDVVIGNYNGTDHTANGSLTVHNKIGIGTNPNSPNAAIKLHIKGYTCTGVTLCSTQIEEGSEEASTIMRIEDEVYGEINRNVSWDFIVSGVNQKLYINSQSGSTVNKVMTLTETGNVGIANSNPEAVLDIYAQSNEKAFVIRNGENDEDVQFYVKADGYVIARDVLVKTGLIFPDYVFDKNYDLKSLTEVEKYISENKHLPDVPSASDIKNSGLNLANMDATLLKKIEELTLYVIDLKKQNEEIQKEIDLLKKQ